MILGVLTGGAVNVLKATGVGAKIMAASSKIKNTVGLFGDDLARVSQGLLNDVGDVILPKQVVTPDGRVFNMKRNDLMDHDRPQNMKMDGDKDGGGNENITRRRWNLPSSKDIKIAKSHGHGGHTTKGERYKQSLKDGGSKDVFNENTSDEAIEKMVMQAYKNNKILKKQANDKTGEIRIFIEGYSKDGTKIQMWINKSTKTIESYWPKC